MGDHFNFIDQNTIEARKRYKDLDTGEVKDYFGKLKNQRRSGFRIMLKEGRALFQLPIKGSDWKIFCHIGRNLDKNNLFKGSRARIAKDLRLSRNTVSSVINTFCKEKVIKEISPSLIFLNPLIFLKGNQKTEEFLIEAYCSKDPMWYFTKRDKRAKPFAPNLKLVKG